ncbi:dual specificity protein phosphatase family protein [Sulfuricurvum sp.]|uniref:dual specificity protein phosphatase family protein n=1 Tax=Sulfuricurvum sp. TaxID=2025608 RepID=UPI002608B1E5|nr:dual specificity protein phosphatase family protein [Sulfuricurvum sp.]MDD4883162.1 dual specificity protein phosphatase family protein [Sulfuricurvum sp.]
MYPFDPALSASATLKERFVWVLFMGALFFILYGAANQYASLTPHPSIFMEWERRIPFVPSFIIPYMSSDVMFCIAFLLPQSRLELRILAMRVLFIVTFSVLIFTLFPLQFGFEKPHSDEYQWLFGLLSADLPYNQLPSLHISFAIVLWASMRSHLTNLFLKYAVALWLWLIALSTLLVYQHHFIDLPTGALMGALAIALIRPNNRVLEKFTTPRSLKVGLYYLATAVLFLVGAFAYHSIIALWLFFSMLAVAIVYAFGFNHLIAGENARASLWQWILFAPYFIGTNLSWRWYKRKLPLMSQVEDRIYFGRYPSQSEYDSIRSLGITHAINLALEHQINRSMIEQTRIPFLDLTIPDPEALHNVVLMIEAKKENGVYVHCALGLSRSVMAISAWMLYRGFTMMQIEERLRELRLAYVKSKYIYVALNLYQTHLNALRVSDSE